MSATHGASKLFCLAAFLVCFLAVFSSMRALAQDNRIRSLFSADSTIRGVAKNELLNHPDPALLPALLEALPSTTGSNRDDLLEVLAKYEDPRKIPVYIAIAKDSKFKTWPQEIGQQLAKLGAPAAQALLDGCAGEDENYATWAGVTIGWMHDAGTRFLIEAVESTDECDHKAGDVGLNDQFGDADPHSESRADIDLAVDAVIDPDERIRNAARQWFDSWKGKENQLDFSGIVEALIRAYQSNAPPETMVKIAQMLSDFERPRVTRFMRAAVHSPNSDIQTIAGDYLMRFPPPAPVARALRTPNTPEEKLKYLQEYATSNTKVIQFLHDSDARVRAKAVEVLGNLNAFSTDSREEREPDPETALPLVRLALKDSSPQVRAAAIEAIDAIRSYDDAALLVEALHDLDASVVLVAEKSLADLPDASATPVLTEIYRNQQYSSEVRDQAFSTLVTLCDPSSTPLFVQGLETAQGVSLTAAEGLVCTLEKQPDPSAFQPVLDAEEHTEDLGVREYLIRALGDTKNPAALPILVRLANSHHPTLAPPAVAALGSLGDRRALPILTELLRDSNHNIRVAAASSFSKFADFTAPPELIAALFDPDAGMAISATKAVTNSHDPRALDAVIAKLPDSMAIYVLGKTHDAQGFPALVAVLQNPANETNRRGAAATALGELGDMRAVDPLIAALNEDNFAITQSSVSALAALKDKRAIEPLQRTRARWSSGQRPNASSVMVNIDMALGTLGATTVQVTGAPQ